jgi:hypothetical protein
VTDAVAELLAALNEAPPFAALAVLTGHLKDMLSAEGVSLLLADYGERTLERLDEGRPMRSAESLPVDGSLAGRAFRRQEALVFLDEQGDRHHVYTPVSIRADRLGVLDVVLTTAPGDEEMDRLGHVATALAYVIAASRPFTDMFERVRRYQRLELAAEIQWGLLPALAYEGDSVSLAGILEPAYEFGGDNFDYSVEEGAVTVSVTDAMGHGLRAAVVGSLAVNALRNARRSGLDLAGQATAANDALVSQFESEQFVSALLMRVDLATGRVEVVDAGHPAAFRVRDGQISALAFEADYPLGMFEDTRHTLREWQMERGDRLVIVSDGVMEAKPDGGDQFGEDGVREVIAGTASLAPTEVVRLVIEAVVGHRGAALRDDATVVCLDWQA